MIILILIIVHDIWLIDGHMMMIMDDEYKDWLVAIVFIGYGDNHD